MEEIKAVIVDRRVFNKGTLKYNVEELEVLMEAVPQEKRDTVRSTSNAIGMPKSTFWYYSKVLKYFKSVRMQVKPALTERHMQNRVEFAYSHMDSGKKDYCLLGSARTSTEDLYYFSQYNTIHIDEKWFYMDKLNRKAFLTKNEKAKTIAVRNKNYIEKVMFLAAVTRPRKYRPRHTPNRRYADLDDDSSDDDNNNKTWYFDGKIGLFPLVKLHTAMRNTKKQTRGDVSYVPIKVGQKNLTEDSVY
jgi:hypothetical protein